MMCSNVHVVSMAGRLARAFVATLGLFAWYASAPPALAQVREFPTTHYYDSDPDELFDYVHGAIHVELTSNISWGNDGQWVSGVVAATDWTDGNYFEIGWTYVRAGSRDATLYPDCVDKACIYTSSSVSASRSHREKLWPEVGALLGGSRPWFKVAGVHEPEMPSGWLRWRAYWAYGGQWQELTSRDYSDDHFAWITSGAETSGGGAHLNGHIMQHTENMYSNRGFGSKWTWQQCSSPDTEIKPWCYTHLITSNCTDPDGCGITRPTGQSGGLTTACVQSGCNYSWKTRTN